MGNKKINSSKKNNNIKKKIKTKEEIDATSRLAMEELLELQNLVLDQDNTKKQKPNIQKLEKQETLNFEPELEQEEEFDPTNLVSIIKRAKKMGKQVNSCKWINPEKDREQDIISKAKKEGKSQYDSDVLREIILERQMKKNESKNLSLLLNKIKK